MLDVSSALTEAATWRDMTNEDVPFWFGEALRVNASWRTWLKPTSPTTLEVAVQAVVDSGATVVAAAGNRAGHVFSPARLPSVYAASYMRVNRTVLPGGGETAEDLPPFGYSQAELSDFALIQPTPTTLGSSFAAPLLSGFVALMPDRTTLSGHRTSVRLSSIAEDLVERLNVGAGEGTGSARRLAVVNSSYQDAINANPHPHYLLRDGDDEPCPQCTYSLVRPTWAGASSGSSPGIWMLRSGSSRPRRCSRHATRMRQRTSP